MKTIKPTRLSILTRTIEHDGKPRLIATVIAGFSFDRPKDLVPDLELWPLVAKALVAENGLLDEGMAKVRGEVLVAGSCYPQGGPAPVSFVGLRVSRGDEKLIDKKVAVIGDREWKHGVPTEPQPFSEMPVDYPHAFGGEGYARNPLGKGYAAVEGRHPLPNIEDRARLINSPGDRPSPAGLGALDFTWPQRFDKRGTYGGDWLEKRAFGFAEDMDPTIFNAAPEDQWLSGFLQGDETFVVENMHPTRSRMEGAMPPLRARVFVTQGEERTFKEIEMRLDTLRLLPNHEIGIMVFRGAMEVAEDDAADIAEILVAGEDPAHPRNAQHYYQALVSRRDHGQGALEAIRETDVMPPAEAGWSVRRVLTDVDKLIKAEHHLQENLKRRKQIELDKARAELLAAGLDPKDFGLDDPPPEVPEVDDTDIDVLLETVKEQERKREDQQKQVNESREHLMKQARAAFEEQGVDFDEAVAKAKKEAAGPPKFSASQQLEWLARMLKIARDNGQPLEELERLLADPKYREQLHTGEQQLRQVYRMSAHLKDPVDTMGRDDSDIQRTEIEVAHHNEIKLESLDYSGVDLSEMSLPGIDLSGGFIEAANLTGTDLSGAKLDDAVLAHAILKGTKLTGASLRGTNLGKSRIDGADLSGCDMRSAVLYGAHITNSSLAGVNLDSAQLLETQLGEGVNLEGATADMLFILRLDLRGARLHGARFSRCVFMECDLRGANLDGVDLTRSLLLECPAEGASFRGATLDSTQFIDHKTLLTDANFEGAQMPQAFLRGLDLTRANLRGANLERADLSSSKLHDAVMDGVIARNALCIRTDFSRATLRSADFLSAIMHKARLFGTQLEGASLFGADLAKVVVDGDTKISGANMTRANVYPKAKQ